MLVWVSPDAGEIDVFGLDDLNPSPQAFGDRAWELLQIQRRPRRRNTRPFRLRGRRARLVVHGRSPPAALIVWTWTRSRGLRRPGDPWPGERRRLFRGLRCPRPLTNDIWRSPSITPAP